MAQTKQVTVVGLTGPNAAGKGEVAHYLEGLGFTYHSLSDVVREEASARGLDHSRENLIRVGNELRARFGAGVLADRIVARIREEGGTGIGGGSRDGAVGDSSSGSGGADSSGSGKGSAESSSADGSAGGSTGASAAQDGPGASVKRSQSASSSGGGDCTESAGGSADGSAAQDGPGSSEKRWQAASGSGGADYSRSADGSAESAPGASEKRSQNDSSSGGGDASWSAEGSAAGSSDARAHDAPGSSEKRRQTASGATGVRAIVDSIRSPAEVAVLRRAPGFVLLGVDAPVAIRFERSRRRARIGDGATLDEFTRKERLENSTDPAAQQLSETLRLADIVIDNSGTLEELHVKVAAALNLED